MSHFKRSGFTLVELLVILAIGVILFGMLSPAGRRVHNVERTRCRNNLRQLIIAVHNYHDVGGATTTLASGQAVPINDMFLPKGCLGKGNVAEERLSWMVAVLPQLEQLPLYQRFDIEKGYDGNRAPADTKLKMFLCLSGNVPDAMGPVTHYIAMAGVGRDAADRPAGASGNGFMGFDRVTTLKMIEDGLSNTITLMETRSVLGPWARGGTSTLRGFDPNLEIWGDAAQFGGHTGGVCAALADGSVRTISWGISAKTLAAAFTIADKDELGTDW